MSYFSGPVDPEDFEDGYAEEAPVRRLSAKAKIALMIVVVTLLGSTFAANISLSGGRKEFGQGIYQIKACDQWVGIGLTAGANSENIYVKNLKLYGFDPRLCVGREFKIKLFQTGSTTPLPLYVDDTSTGLAAGDTTSALTLMDTSTAYSGSYSGPGGTGYNGWAADAVTIINALGANIGWYNSRIYINYVSSTGVYVVVFAKPAALVANVTSVTIESAKYS